MKLKALPLLFAALTLVSACRKDVAIPEGEKEFISFIKPDHFPDPVYTFDKNPLTAEGFLLGRKLFFDPKLSRDNDISCASCHIQKFAFSDPAHGIPHGTDGKLGTRNAPGIFNVAWKKTFMWDGGINHIEVMPLGPIGNPLEMDQDFAALVTELQNTSEYPALFEKAFGSPTITGQNILLAFAQYMGAMVSSNSPFDKYLKGDKNALTKQQIAGKQTFESKCGTCHAGVLQTDNSFRNIGIPSADSGRALITRQAQDLGKFIVPSLRNVALTFPYMHNATLTTLEQVLDHYQRGGVPNPQLDPLMRGGIKLSPDERTNILAFLKSLTDEDFVKDVRFSEPLP